MLQDLFSLLVCTWALTAIGNNGLSSAYVAATDRAVVDRVRNVAYTKLQLVRIPGRTAITWYTLLWKCIVTVNMVCCSYFVWVCCIWRQNDYETRQIWKANMILDQARIGRTTSVLIRYRKTTSRTAELIKAIYQTDSAGLYLNPTTAATRM